MRKDSLIPNLMGIPPIQIGRELLLYDQKHCIDSFSYIPDSDPDV
jgi:hypothetical protein